MRPHKKLVLWQESITFVEEIYSITSRLPDAEKYGLISQLRRAAASIPTNVAEGAARNTKKEFIHFLYIASGSLSEVDTLLTISVRLKFLTGKEINSYEEKMRLISSLLSGLLKKLKAEV